MADGYERLTVLVPSTDRYSDLWVPFLHYLGKFWGSQNSKILLGSNFVNGQFVGAEVCSVGTSEHWGEHVLKLLDRVATDAVLLIMPDFFIDKLVNRQRFEEYLEVFEQEELNCLSLTPRPSSGRYAFAHRGCKSIDVLGAYSINLDVALWKVTALRKVLKLEDSPWSLERSDRITNEDPRKWCFAIEPVFSYVSTGALIRGSWTRESKRRLTYDGLQESLGSRAVLTRRASFRYAIRTVVFRGVWLVMPNLIHRYNNYLVGVSGRVRRIKFRR